MNTKTYSQFFALLKQMPGVIDKKDTKEDFICQYTNGRTISLKEMKAAEYKQMCADMQATIRSANAKRDNNPNTWRKRVMAAIGEYLRNLNLHDNPDIIKGIACRSTQYDNFNQIPIERLRNLYNTFLNKNKDFANTGKVIEDEITILINLN